MAVGLRVVWLVGTVGQREEVRHDQLADAGTKAIVLALHEVTPNGAREAELTKDVVTLCRNEEAVVVLIELDLLRLILTPTTCDRRASVGLTLDARRVLVRAHTQLSIEPVGDLVLQRCTDEEAVTRIVVEVVLACPVGVRLITYTIPAHITLRRTGFLEVADVHTAGQ